MRKRYLTHFGVDNIDKSLVGYIFTKNGFKINFVDDNNDFVKGINDRHQYSDDILNYNNQVYIIYGVKAILNSAFNIVIDNMFQSEVITVTIGKDSNLKYLQEVFERYFYEKTMSGGESIQNIIYINNNDDDVDFEKLVNFEEYPYLKGIISISEAKVEKIISIPSKESYPDFLYEFCIDESKWLGPKIEFVEYCKNLEIFSNQKHFLSLACSALISLLSYDKYQFVYGFQKSSKITKFINNYIAYINTILYHKYPDSKNKLETYAKRLLVRLKSYQNKSRTTDNQYKSKLIWGVDGVIVAPFLYACKNKLDSTWGLKALKIIVNSSWFKNKSLFDILNEDIGFSHYHFVSINKTMTQLMDEINNI